MTKIEEHQERARKHRERASGLYAHYDEGGMSEGELYDILLAGMEELYQATRSETYASMLKDPHDPMWRCIEREKQKKPEAGPVKQRTPFNHKEFNKNAQILADKAREQRKIKNLFFS